MYKVIKLQDTEVFVVLTALEAYAKGSKSISAVASLIADKIDKYSWQTPPAPKPELKVGMRVFFCEPDLTSGSFIIDHFECNKEGTVMYACDGHNSFCVNVAFCEPKK